jgi:hypothetical protein
MLADPRGVYRTRGEIFFSFSLCPAPSCKGETRVRLLVCNGCSPRALCIAHVRKSEG